MARRSPASRDHQQDHSHFLCGRHAHTARAGPSPSPHPRAAGCRGCASGWPARWCFEQVAPEFRHHLFGLSCSGGRFLTYFHKDDADGQPITRGVEVDIDPASLQVIARREVRDADIEHQRSALGLAHFFVDLHGRLHLPHPWGLLLTGILGLAMLAAAVSGLVIHRHR